MKLIHRFVAYAALLIVLIIIFVVKRDDIFFSGRGGLAAHSHAPYFLPGKNHPSRAVREYCNNPQDIRRGDEGNAPPGYELISVQLMIRHGNRLPMPEHFDFGNLVLPPISCKLNPSHSYMPAELGEYIENVHGYVKSKLVLSQTEEIDDDPGQQCAPADLTQIGVEQHIANGLALKKVYGDTLSLTEKDVKIFVTRTQRTFTSAFAFAFGLLTDLIPQKLSVEHVENVEFCVPNTMNENCNCPRAKTLFAESENDLSKRLRKVDMNFLHSLESVKKSLELPDMRAPYPWKIGHDFMVLPLCRGQFPHCVPNDESHCLTFEQEDLNWDSLNFYFKNMFEHAKMRLSAKLAMYPLLSAITERMLNHVALVTDSKAIPEKVVVFSGHDNSIHPLMLSLGLPTSDWPPYASRLTFELYKPLGGSAKDYIFKIIYNGKDVTDLTSFCGESPCSLNNLVHFQRDLIASLGYSSYDSACKDDSALLN